MSTIITLFTESYPISLWRHLLEVIKSEIGLTCFITSYILVEGFQLVMATTSQKVLMVSDATCSLFIFNTELLVGEVKTIAIFNTF